MPHAPLRLPQLASWAAGPLRSCGKPNPLRSAGAQVEVDVPFLDGLQPRLFDGGRAADFALELALRLAGHAAHVLKGPAPPPPNANPGFRACPAPVVRLADARTGGAGVCVRGGGREGEGGRGEATLASIGARARCSETLAAPLVSRRAELSRALPGPRLWRPPLWCSPRAGPRRRLPRRGWHPGRTRLEWCGRTRRRRSLLSDYTGCRHV